MEKQKNLKLILATFLIASILATAIIASDSLSSDKDKTYDPIQKEIIIKNKTTDSNIISLKLTENTYVCGTDCYAENEITIFNDGPLIDDVRFYQIKEGISTERSMKSYNFVIGKSIDIDDYKLVCSETGEIYKNESKEIKCDFKAIGTRKEVQYETYVVGQKVPAGTYTMKIYGKKQPYESWDWQIKSQGYWTTEWAVWGNLSSGGTAQVFLDTPTNPYTTNSNPTTFNCSANSTATDTIGGSDSYIQNTSIIYVGGGSSANPVGMKVLMKANVKLNSFHVYAFGNGNCYVSITDPNSQDFVGTKSGNLCVFAEGQVNLTSGSTYYFLITGSWTEGTGGTYTFPISNTYLNWTSGYADGYGDNPTAKFVDWANVTATTSSTVAKGILNLTLVINGVNNKTVTNTSGGQNLSLSANLNLGSDMIWTCKACDADNCGFALENYTFNWGYTPTTKLISPINNINLTYRNYVNFSCNATVTAGNISNITFYIWNSTKDLVYNTTTKVSGLFNKTDYSYSFSYSDTFKWNCKAYETLNKNAFASSNYTLTIDLFPTAATIVDNYEFGKPSSTPSLSTFISYLVSDDVAVSNVYYNITNSSGYSLASNGTANNSSFSIPLTLTDYGNYQINLTVNDSRNQITSIVRNFKLSLISGGAASGGAAPMVDNFNNTVNQPVMTGSLIGSIFGAGNEDKIAFQVGIVIVVLLLLGTALNLIRK